MAEELKFYFTFGSNHFNPATGEAMKDYWIEVIVHENYSSLTSMEISMLREKARKTMFSRYGRKWSMQYDEKQFDKKYFPKGCYQTLYYPLPDEIEIQVANKFASGDMVRPKLKKEYNNLDVNYFHGETKKVVRVEEVPGYDVAGEQFVYVIIDGAEHGFYSIALEKVY